VTNPRAEDFGRRLFRLGQNWRREIDIRMRGFGLTDATWRPLYYLGRFGDGMRQTDLAAALAIEGPSLVRLLDALERQGLVERHAEPDDRRVKTLRMTPAGHATYQQLAMVYAEVSDRLLSEVSDAEIEVCLRVFGLIERALENGLSPLDGGRA
jgi:MarR family transcriptional regulator, transcriptional regulator for hemolysin